MIPGGVKRTGPPRRYGAAPPVRVKPAAPESQRTQRYLAPKPKPAPSLSPEQHHNLVTILHVAHHLAAKKKPLKAAVETAIVESKLHNLSYGDRDSVGVFQQRPSAGWKGLRNVHKAATEFLTQAMAQAPKYSTAGELAQAVQRSAYPRRYQQHSSDAEALLHLYRKPRTPYRSY